MRFVFFIVDVVDAIYRCERSVKFVESLRAVVSTLHRMARNPEAKVLIDRALEILESIPGATTTKE